MSLDGEHENITTTKVTDTLTDIKIVLPEQNDDLLGGLLVELTKAISEAGEEIAVQGFLGGTYGYGADYKNDVFEMRPFYWGDCECDYDTLRDEWSDNNSHDEECYQTLFHNMHYVNYGADGGWNFDVKPGHERDKETFDDICDCIDTLYRQFKIPAGTPGSHVHCTCMHDINYANFLKTISHADECLMDKPNFLHYASGLEVEWYKYIGRSQEVKAPQELTGRQMIAIFEECFKSLEK